MIAVVIGGVLLIGMVWAGINGAREARADRKRRALIDQYYGEDKT